MVGRGHANTHGCCAWNEVLIITTGVFAGDRVFLCTRAHCSLWLERSRNYQGREKIRYLTAHFLRYQLEAGTVTGQDGVESLAGYSAPVDAPAIRTGEWPAGNSRRRGDGRLG